MKGKLNKKSFSVVVMVVFLVFVALCNITKTSNAYAVYFNGTTRLLPIYEVDRNDNKISISFDCAYGADYTLKLLDILDEYKVKCTFFCVEFWINKFPDMAKEIVKRGHEIGTHSKTHPKMSTLTESEIKNELTSSINVIESVTNTKGGLKSSTFVLVTLSITFIDEVNSFLISLSVKVDILG